MIPRLATSAPAATLALLVALGLSACGSDDAELQPGEERASPHEARHTATMIEAIKAKTLQDADGGPVRRFNQGKTLGCFDARFVVAAQLPATLRQGIFAQQKSYPAQLRFANASSDDDSERDFRGVSVKLQQVEGEPLWGRQGVQDFLFNSYPGLFAANPADFASFVEASRRDQLWRYFIDPRHFYSLAVLLKGRQKIDNPFAIRYWSTTPYRFGPDTGTAVKYTLQPCGTPPALELEPDQDFLTEAMTRHLRAAPACFEFGVQFQGDPTQMPIEDASVIWDESESPFLTVATIMIENGGTSATTQATCEAMSFNPWQSLAAHQPLGGINRTRRAIYAEIGAFRQQHNNAAAAANNGGRR